LDNLSLKTNYDEYQDTFDHDGKEAEARGMKAQLGKIPKS